MSVISARLALLAALILAPGSSVRALSLQDPSPVALPGFVVEELYAAPREEGSWICMAFDPQGRITVSAETGPLRRITLKEGGKTVAVEALDDRVQKAMGLLYAFGALYVNGAGPEGTGMYRLRDLDRDGRYEELKLLRAWDSIMTDHGPHAIIRGPDDHLYVLNGNYVRDPKDLSPRSPYRGYQEDLLLPRMWDSVGHAVEYASLRAPGGHVFRTDPEGKSWELFLGGLRNAYDFDFDPEGELFTFDSDMDWDQGLPWYRPNRILHGVSGGEYGWRSGSGNWPAEYPDSLPAVVDVGLASPTGVAFGTRAAFPARYRRALFAADWAYGRILAVHRTPEGASYTATFENFVKGTPLAVTDLEFGPDGAMYFITGGRRTQSKLYRIRFQGADDDQPAPADPAAAKARALRRRLESLHGRREAGIVDDAWPHLGSPDRWIRAAARIALEHQDPALWRERALGEKDPQAALSALLALVRTASREAQPGAFEALDRLDWSRLKDVQRRYLLRLYSLLFIRLGAPEPAQMRRLTARLEPLYPTGDLLLDRELGALLVCLGVPSVVETMVKQLDAGPQEEQVHRAMLLRLARSGWTKDLRRSYLSWFERASGFRGGTSVPAMVRNILADALVRFTEKERLDHDAQIQALSKVPARTVKDPGLVLRAWTMNDLLPDLPKRMQRRSFRGGEAAFDRVNCRGCHRFAGQGGSSAPDITAASSRFNRRELLESILEPSKVVSEQFQNTVFKTRSGEVVVGRILKELDGRLHLQTHGLDETVTILDRSAVEATRPSTLSPMPEGLLNTLDREAILDLLAYIESGGDPGNALFRK